MINKNMMEKSVISLKDNVPAFVRNSYTQFADVLKETVNVVKTLSETSPYTANKLAGEILDGLPMLKVLKEMMPEHEDYHNLLKRLTNLNITISDKINADEEFSIVNGTDIYAPLTHICACITPFSSKKLYNSSSKVIPIVYEICKGDRPIEMLTEWGNGFKPLRADDIEGYQGQKTVLENLGTCLGIDVSQMFQRFMNDLMFDMTRSESNAVDILETIYNRIDSENSVVEIEEVTKDLLATTVSTYFVYASKLVGSKEDIYTWAYTAFVKDSMNHFDKAHYPVNANVTRASGHAINGQGYDGNSGRYDEATMDMNVNEYSSNGTDDMNAAYKAMIYRNIRLQYSSWATVINAIFTSAFRAKTADYNSIFTEEYTRNIGRGKGFDNFAATNTEYAKMCHFVCEALVQYAAAKYRTYNTSVQLCGKDLRPEDSSRLIEAVISGCRDEIAVKIVKESISNYKINQIYIQYNDDVAGVLATNEGVKNALSKTFMDVSYLIILNYVHSTMSKVMEETDPVTGKTNKSLFEEIYYGVKRAIYMDIEQYSHKNCCKLVAKDMVSAYTPYVLDDNCDSILHELKEARHHHEEFEHGHDHHHEHDDGFNPFIEIVCMPFVSEYSKLKQVYDFDNFSSGVYAATNNQTGSKFPKNKIIVDGLAKLGHELTLNRAFSSIESAEEYVKTIRNRVEEGADCMASNACYSALGAIGGGITELEIKNEADDNYLSDTVAKLTDTDGNAIKQGTSDTQDLANAVTHALESCAPNPIKQGKDVVSDFNKLFNNVILGL